MIKLFYHERQRDKRDHLATPKGEKAKAESLGKTHQIPF